LLPQELKNGQEIIKVEVYGMDYGGFSEKKTVFNNQLLLVSQYDC